MIVQLRTFRWMTVHRELLIGLAVFLNSLLASAAVGQCEQSPEGAAPGKWVRNYDPTTQSYNIGTTVDGQEINLADPTILKLQDYADPPQTWFFLTGTSATANFPIYRSTDLVHWRFHSWVFDSSLVETDPAWNVPVLFITDFNNNQRAFKHFWSPQLYYDPTNGDGIIYIAFAAAELWDNDLDDDGVQDNDLDSDGVVDAVDSQTVTLKFNQQQITPFVMWAEKSRFLDSSAHWATATWRNYFPQVYGYKVNNTGAYARDGGYAQRLASGDNFVAIPSSGHTADGRYDVLSDPTLDRRWHAQQQVPGDAYKVSHGFHWTAEGPRTWMADAPNVFFDPNQGCRPWISWTWSSSAGLLTDRNNVAAYPLLDTSHNGAGYRLMNALYDNPHFAPGQDTQPLQLFFAYNTSHTMKGVYNPTIPNGKIIQNWNNPDLPAEGGWGIAEGPTVFWASGRYYALATRNAWNQPSYQIVYRMSPWGATSVDSLHLPWSLQNPPASAMESILVASDWVQKIGAVNGDPEWRDGTSRTNYGNADHFEAYGRHYLVFHQTRDVSNLGLGRRIFIKNLGFDGLTGEIGRWYENGSKYGFWPKAADVFWFVAPDVGDVASAPVR